MKHVVVLGAGYAGLKTVVVLQKKLRGQVKITLVNDNPYHYEATDLHELAAGNQTADKITFPISDVLNPAMTTLLLDHVERVDEKTRTVELRDHDPLKYDYCVFALGFVSETFGIKGAVENSLPMTNVKEAEAIHTHIVAKLKDYRQTKNADDLKLVICGGGFTGIELAGALAEARPRYAKLAGVNPDQIEIEVIDAAKHLLPMFKAQLADYGVRLLKKVGVKITTGALIQEIKPGEVVYKGADDGADQPLHQVTAQTIIWTTGVSGSPIVAASGLQQRRGRVMDSDHLTAPDDDQLYIAGDVAAVMPPDGKRPYPTTAQIALSMADYIAEDIAARIKGSKRPGKYTYKSLGTVASIGNTHALGEAGGLSLKGYPASVMKKMIMNKSLMELGGFRELFAKGRFDIYH